eukprot:8398025-Pyramimonas_sp.AAC.1
MSGGGQEGVMRGSASRYCSHHQFYVRRGSGGGQEGVSQQILFAPPILCQEGVRSGFIGQV